MACCFRRKQKRKDDTTDGASSCRDQVRCFGREQRNKDDATDGASYCRDQARSSKEDEVELHVSRHIGLGISVVKEHTGWSIQHVKPGLIEDWNRIQPERMLGPGDRLMSANGFALRPGMNALDYADKNGVLRLCVQRATTITIDGLSGTITWDGRPHQGFARVRWSDGNIGGVVFIEGATHKISRMVTEAFIGNPSHVDLSHRSLGDEGAKHVAWMLDVVSPCPTSLCLNYAEIGNEGAERLADAIERSHVSSVDLLQNRFSAELRERIAYCLLERSRIRFLVIVHCTRDGAQLQLDFTSMCGDTIFGQEIVDPCLGVHELRNLLQGKPDAQGHKIEMVAEGQFLLDGYCIGSYFLGVGPDAS